MQSIANRCLAILALAAVSFACTDSRVETITYTANAPVYMPIADFRSSFAKSEPVEMVQTGKIYFKDNLLFVNEVNRGIHVIDNADPTSPQIIAFYEIIGNVDMAIRGNTLFADSYIDLVAIDISDVNNPVEIGRLPNVFPGITPYPEDLNYPMAQTDSSRGVVVGWEVKEVTEEYQSASSPWYDKIWFGNGRESMDGVAPTGSGSTVGVAGSMARFMLNDYHLYTISTPQRITTLDVINPQAMVAVDSVDTWRTMETLFKYQDYLFVGTTTGMMIFDVANPASPVHVSDYDHITACDPVVVDGQYAYVTLRSGNNCLNAENLLEVIDITNIASPFLVKSYPMFNPHGLGVDNGLLFICDGAAGLKVFRTDDPLRIVQNHVVTFPDMEAFDVIPYNGVLMMVATDGIYQYDYSDTNTLSLLSHLTLTP